MREIKFRGERIDNGEWAYGDLINYVNGKTAIRNTESWLTHWVDPATVGQYTGLKDKGGTESYHKDIVRTNAEQVGVVEFGSYSPTGNEWDNTWGWFIQFPNGGQISMDEHFRCWGEVVGNIYDNPELLEGDE